jgi:pimeloyl-ACP methyl ester carboxylesterase
MRADPPRHAHLLSMSLLGLAVLSLLLSGCGSPAPSAAPASSPPFVLPTASGSVDYSVASTWVTVPTATTYPVDVFYLCDTTYTKPTASSPPIGPIDAPSMVSGNKEVLTWTATAFSTVANIYAPYYRQVDVATQKSMTDAQQMATVGGVPTADATAAFEYYLAHYNHGRSFILAGHSQGSSVLSHLLADYMPTHPDVYARMVAAYVIGYPIGRSYLAANPTLRFAQSATDTGVIVSYNTEATSIASTNPVMVGVTDAVVINPITWTQASTPASAAASLGSFLPDATTKKLTKVLGFADATVDPAKGVLVASTPNAAALFKANSSLPEGVYHSYDYMFYYFDLRANAAARIAAFAAKA